MPFSYVDPKDLHIQGTGGRIHRHSFRHISGMRWENDTIVIGQTKSAYDLDSVWFCDGCEMAADLEALILRLLDVRNRSRISMIEYGSRSVVRLVPMEEPSGEPA